VARPEEAAEAVAELEPELELELEPEQEQALELELELARELVAVTRSSLAPRSLDNRYHRNP
jgi:hypothetical protein